MSDIKTTFGAINQLNWPAFTAATVSFTCMCERVHTNLSIPVKHRKDCELYLHEPDYLAIACQEAEDLKWKGFEP